MRANVFTMSLFVSVFWIGQCSVHAGERYHVWETMEISLNAQKHYANPYTDVDVWLRLKGPNFDRKVYGFWDGGDTFRVRVVGTKPGTWTWTSDSNQNDSGLNNQSGSFTAVPWTEKEKESNPNRRGTIRPTPNGRALQYADGTPFFLLADTHWAAATWRYPYKGREPAPAFQLGPNMGFEETAQHLKGKGFNSIAFIACFPNWALDDYSSYVKDDAGVEIRRAWQKPGTAGKCMDMHDEMGNRPFFLPGKSQGKQDVCADFDRINPAYWQSLDRKMDYFQANGFVPYLETVRRDNVQSWRAYHNFKKSFARFLLYIRARYGTKNFIYTLIHGDSVAGDWVKDVSEACNHYHAQYGDMPFGQPTTIMASHSSLHYFGHSDKSPWMQLHTSGNRYRHHGIYEWMEKQFRHPNPIPVFNNEPYYVGHKNPGGAPAENPPSDPKRDSYFGRAHLWGNVLSGGLAGHVYGSTAWPGVTTGEPPYSERTRAVHFWESFSYPAHRQVCHIKKFLLSEGTAYRKLELASDDLHPRRTKGWRSDSLDHGAYMMRTDDKKLALLYFEDLCEKSVVKGMESGETYSAAWFDPRSGEWIDAGVLTAEANGTIRLPDFPENKTQTAKNEDWALKLKKVMP